MIICNWVGPCVAFTRRLEKFPFVCKTPLEFISCDLHDHGGKNDLVRARSHIIGADTTFHDML